MESGIKDHQRAAPCPWCGAAVPMSGHSLGWPSEEGFLRCDCGVWTVEEQAGASAFRDLDRKVGPVSPFLPRTEVVSRARIAEQAVDKIGVG